MTHDETVEREKAKAVGHLLDMWEQYPNDERSCLMDPLRDALNSLMRAYEGSAALSALPRADDALEGLRELSERATKGEWGTGDWQDDFGDDKVTVETSRPEVLSPGQSSIWPGGLVKVRVASTEDGDNPLEDAAFIAAAVNYVRARLAQAGER